MPDRTKQPRRLPPDAHRQRVSPGSSRSTYGNLLRTAANNRDVSYYKEQRTDVPSSSAAQLEGDIFSVVAADGFPSSRPANDGCQFISPSDVVQLAVNETRCPYCAYTCHRKDNLRVHIRRHTGEKPYACNKCPRTFVSKSELNTHVKYHSGILKYSCSFCSFTSLTEELFMSHKCPNFGATPFPS